MAITNHQVLYLGSCERVGVSSVWGMSKSLANSDLGTRYFALFDIQKTTKNSNAPAAYLGHFSYSDISTVYTESHCYLPQFPPENCSFSWGGSGWGGFPPALLVCWKPEGGRPLWQKAHKGYGTRRMQRCNWPSSKGPRDIEEYWCHVGVIECPADFVNDGRGDVVVELKQIHGKSFVNKFPPRFDREKEGPQETQKFSNFQVLVSQRLLQSKLGHFKSLHCL